MPQLDKVTFLTQYVWLCILFFSIYLVLVKIFLPAFARIAQVRPAVAASKTDSMDVMTNESTPDIRSTSLESSMTVLQKHTTFLVEWIQKVLTKLGNTIVLNFVRLYKNMSISLLASQNTVRRAVPPISWMQSLLLNSESYQSWIAAKVINQPVKKGAKAD